MTELQCAGTAIHLSLMPIGDVCFVKKSIQFNSMCALSMLISFGKSYSSKMLIWFAIITWFVSKKNTLPAGDCGAEYSHIGPYYKWPFKWIAFSQSQELWIPAYQ